MNVHHKPAVQEYDSIVFPSFEAGVKCMHEVGQVEESLLPPIGELSHVISSGGRKALRPSLNSTSGQRTVPIWTGFEAGISLSNALDH